MKRFAVAIVLSAFVATPAKAEIYNYTCRSCMFPSIPRDGSDGCEVVGRGYPLRVDDKKNVLDWRGKRYNLTEAPADQPYGCAKYGWHAKGNGTSFTFCVATQGYGAIEDKGDVRVRCDLKK
ncbi:hypothetical protein [Rhodopseudomonas sp. BR0G17]|uniref:hypothetical protein n=1 Tax=Rhodopseudomonas sp. BR0G17 TaxID=2269368 RepID=UPI0013DEA1A6|nr:hypothetical protein [Rhodopseudomonas sp. BR0G17]